MTTALTPVAERTALLSPLGPDPASRATLVALMQGIANRAEWASKSLIDIKNGVIQSGDDYTNTSFADMLSNPTLTFTDVKVGDKIVLHAAGSFSVGTFTADGTDPSMQLRWLLGGATDLYTGTGYPILRWGSTVVASDARALVAPGVHIVAADAPTLTATLQNKVTNPAASPVFTEGPVFLTGTHYRLGAA